MSHYVLITTLLLALTCEVHCQCTITRNEVEKSNRIFTYRDAQGAYQLLRTANVDNGVTLYLFCTSDKFVETTCRGKSFVPALPMSCQNPMQAGVNQLDADSCPATMYAIGYKIDNHFLELYRACYDRKQLRAHFSEVLIYLKNFFPQRPDVRFSTDNLITPAEEASFLTRKIYNTFRHIFGSQQNYLPNNRDVIINRGHLTASADFLFADQSAATFKYVNVVPQFKSINDGNWESIEKWVRNQIPANGALRVRTGGIGVLALPDASPQHTPHAAYLSGGTKNPVPEWMYKTVMSTTNEVLYVFLTYNNIYANQRPAAPAFCPTVDCPPLQLTNSAAAGYTYCCSPAQFAV